MEFSQTKEALQDRRAISISSHLHGLFPGGGGGIMHL